MPLDRIMVTVDGSKHGEGVLRAVHRIVNGAPARIRILQVVSSIGLVGDTAGIEAAADRLEAMGCHDETIIQPYLKQGGNAAQTILDEIDLHRPELVAMATHGRTGLSRVVMGSTTETVIRSCDVPILVCNGHSAAMAGGDAYRRILVPLDGSSVADATLPLVTRVAAEHGAEVMLLRVDAAPLQEGTRRFANIAGYLDHYASSLESAGVAKVEIIGTSGDPVPSILEMVETRRIDLVAMGTHGRTGVDRLRSGSVAEEVLRRCPCPVVLRNAAA